MFQLTDRLNPLAIGIIALILAIMLVSIAVSILIRKKYSEIGAALDITKATNEPPGGFEVLSSIVDDYKNTAKGNIDEINTQVIIEKNFNLHHKGLYIGERFVKSSVSLMIILGLLGTFYGLTLSIGKLVELLSNSANAEVLSSMDSIVDGLINSVRGMSVAFITSLFGIASSIIITIFNILFNISDVRESLMIEIEEYLDNKLALELNRDNRDKYDMITQNLKDTFESFGNKITDNFKYVINVSSENLAAATKEMENTASGLLHVIQRFENAIDKFNDNTKDFSQFNHELRTNIQRMNVTMSDFTSDLKKITEIDKG